MNEEVMKELKQQTMWGKVTACCMAGILLVIMVSAFILVPKASSMLTGAEKTLDDINVAVGELNKTANDLAEIDFKGLADSTQQLVADGTDGIAEALTKIDGIDIESLNQAIDDFGSVVAPMAKLFGRK